jgi:hypothetical protein
MTVQSTTADRPVRSDRRGMETAFAGALTRAQCGAEPRPQPPAGPAKSTAGQSPSAAKASASEPETTGTIKPAAAAAPAAAASAAAAPAAAGPAVATASPARTKPAPAPFSDAQLKAVEERTGKGFNALLEKEPDGSPGRILHRLMTARAIAGTSEFKGKVDTDRLDRDTAALTANPRIQSLLERARSDATQAVLHKTPVEVGDALRRRLNDPATIAHLRSLPPSDRRAAADAMIAPVAVLVPFAAEKAYRQFVGAQLDFSDPSRALRSASPEAVEVAVKSVFDVALTQSRFTTGALHKFGDALKRLSAKQLDAAATALGADLRAGKPLDAASLGKVTGSTHEFLVGANRAGLFGSLEGVIAAVAIVKDLSGRSDGKPRSGWDNLRLTGDVLKLIGSTENFYKLARSLDLDTAAAAAFRAAGAAFGAPSVAANATIRALVQAGRSATSPAALAEATGPTALAELRRTLMGSGLSADEAAQAIAQARATFTAGMADDAVIYALEDGRLVAPKALTEAVRALALKGGLSSSEASAAAQIVRNAVTKGLPGAQSLTLAESSISSAGLFTVSKVLSGLGGLGSVASLLSSARSVHDAQESFKEGDATGGWLNGTSAVAAGVSGVAGIGATVGTLFGVAALSGPLLPAVAVGAAVVGIGAAGWNYFHQKHRHEQQVSDQKQFLQGGVGNGRNYLAVP